MFEIELIKTVTLGSFNSYNIVEDECFMNEKSGILFIVFKNKIILHNINISETKSLMDFEENVDIKNFDTIEINNILIIYLVCGKHRFMAY